MRNRTSRQAALLTSLAIPVVLAACTPSPPQAPVSAECRAEVHNETGVLLDVTAFGRDKLELGRVEPGGFVTFTELCRVERVPVRGAPTNGLEGADPVWAVVVLWPGETVRIRLGA